MIGPARVLYAGAAASAMVMIAPLATAAQAPRPITFTLTIAGPYSGRDGFDVHIDLPVSPQARDLCVPPGSAGSSVPVCATGHAYTTVYEASEWPTVPFWYERSRGGTTVQTFGRAAVSAAHSTTVQATFTYAAGISVPATGVFPAGSVPGLGLLLVALGSLLMAGSTSMRSQTLRVSSGRAGPSVSRGGVR